MRKKNKRMSPDILDQIAAFLKANGWTVIVAGPTQVRQEIGAAKYNFEFVVKFTGSKREPVPSGSPK